MAIGLFGTDWSRCCERFFDTGACTIQNGRTANTFVPRLARFKETPMGRVLKNPLYSPIFAKIEQAVLTCAAVPAGSNVAVCAQSYEKEHTPYHLSVMRRTSVSIVCATCSGDSL